MGNMNQDLMDKIITFRIIALWCQLHWALYQENLKDHSWRIFCPDGIIPDSGLTGLNNTHTYTHTHIYIYIYIYIWALWLNCSPMARDIRVQSQIESYQRLKTWYLMPPCLTLSIIRYGSRIKSNSRKRIASFPTSRCCSYWKGSLRVTLDYGRQLYLLYIYIYILK